MNVDSWNVINFPIPRIEGRSSKTTKRLIYRVEISCKGRISKLSLSVTLRLSNVSRGFRKFRRALLCNFRKLRSTIRSSN